MRPRPELDPPVDDAPPDEERITDYDYVHMVTYLRLLDAASDGADWREVAAIVLHIDPEIEPLRARHVFDAHMERARWMSRSATATCSQAGKPGEPDWGGCRS